LQSAIPEIMNDKTVKGPIISIICPTYNQEKFIAQTLDSFLMQKTDFSFEIIVHDDASTDNTTKIVKSYESSHPGFFSNIYQSENQFSKGSGEIGKIVYKRAKGKYTALCEGDDYWTDPFKLQKQVGFLEANNEYSICYHRVKILKDDNSFLPESLNLSDENETYSILDLAKGNIMHTPSVVFRNNLFEQFPDWFFKSPIGDYPLHMLNARFGKIYYIPEYMAVYRIHEKGMWSTTNEKTKIKGWAETLGFLAKEFNDDPEIEQILKYKYAQNLNSLSILYSDEQNFEQSAKYLANAFAASDQFATEWLKQNEGQKRDYESLLSDFNKLNTHFLLRSARAIKNPVAYFKRILKKLNSRQAL
jgi:glycosyltransferase involved in cell wall biosynthesis